MTSHDLVAELKAPICRCGNKKANVKTFCTDCYWKLPPLMRMALYQRIGEGYEEARAKAVAYLVGLGRIKP
jgi:hypothetical protein